MMTREEWFNHHKAQLAGEISVVEYCRENKITSSQWYSYRKRYLRNSNKSQSPKFITPVISDHNRSARIILKVGDGIELEFPEAIKPQTIALITKVVSETLK